MASKSLTPKTTPPPAKREKNGRWQKGQSANPGGRSNARKDFEKLIQEIATAKSNNPAIGNALIERMLELANQDEHLPTARSATAYLADQGYGRARQRVEVSGPNDSPVEIAAARATIASIVDRFSESDEEEGDPSEPTG